MIPPEGMRSLTEAVELNKEAPRIISTFGNKEFKAAVGFVDMRGFSGKARGMKPSEVYAIAKPFIEKVIRAATKLSWCIDKTIGDEVMVIRPFLEQDAQYALPELVSTYAVMEVTSFVAKLLLALKANALDDHFTGGFAIGKVMLDRVGVDEFNEWTCYGNTINAAKRLQHEASEHSESGNVIAVGSLTCELPNIKEQLEVWLQLLPGTERIKLIDASLDQKDLIGVGETIFVQGRVELKDNY